MVHPVVGVHGVFDFGDVGILRDVVDRCGGEAHAHLAPVFVVDIRI